MKTIFLDFDGVLHPDGAGAFSSTDDGHALFVEEEKLYVVGEKLFCWLPILDDLLGEREVSLVIHSSWRHQFRIEVILAHFPARLRERVKGMTKGGNRHGSVVRYVADQALTDFVVLDDQAQWFPPDWPPLIACDPDVGISQSDVKARLQGFLERSI